MKTIISGTNRPGSRTRQVAQLIFNIYKEMGEPIEMIDLEKLPLTESVHKTYTGPHSGTIGEAINQINRSSGLIVVCPEYNGSYPGILKFFLDHWAYPESFEYRPVCLVGLGGRFGALRPVEHLQQVFGYRNSFVFPQRVFLFNIWESLKEGELKDPAAVKMLREQAEGFSKFVLALQSQGLDANSRAKKT